jgi:hypothetical protein
LFFKSGPIGLAFYDRGLQAHMAGDQGLRYALYDSRRHHFLFDQFFDFLALADFDEGRGAQGQKA